MTNLYADIPERAAAEEILELIAHQGLRIERIVSHGHATPPGVWYDQPGREWVVVVRGAARLRFEDEGEPRDMKAGDWVDIAAHRRHRVEWTDPRSPTLWLAVHYG
jgi:cupin 2 domain-containing protein